MTWSDLRSFCRTTWGMEGSDLLDILTPAATNGVGSVRRLGSLSPPSGRQLAMLWIPGPMQPEFWKERWQLGQTGFHQDEVHADLQTNADWLLSSGRTVLVPLCGKTNDLDWIARRGNSVVGVELSGVAAAAAFENAGRTPSAKQMGAMVRWSHDTMSVLEGDVFDIHTELIHDARAVWDRAALIALPPKMRERYVAHLRSVLGPGTRILLNVLAYNDCQKEGPPHSVGVEEVHRLYEGAQIELVDRRQRPDFIRPHWRDAGMTELMSLVFRIAL